MKKNAQFPKDYTKKTEERKIDEQLKAMAGRSKITPPEGYEERLEQLLNTHSGKRAGMHFTRWGTAAAVLAVVLFAGVSVKGTIYYLNTRMGELSDTEIADYNQAVQGALVDADRYTRKLSEEEEERLEKLQEEYLTEGRCPDKELAMVSDQENVNDGEVCYVENSSTYYLPERSLTDEELLELIDFRYKRDYSVIHSNQEDGETGTEVIGETEFAAAAAEAVKAALGIDTTQLYCEMQKNPSGTMYTLEYKKDNHLLCYVGVDCSTGRVVTVEEVLTQPEAAEYKEDVVSEGGQAVLSCLSKTVWKASDICKGTAWYAYCGDGTEVYNGRIQYVTELPDGAVYVTAYDMNEKKIVAVNYYEKNDAALYAIPKQIQTKYGLTEVSEELTEEGLVKYHIAK